MRWIRKTKEKKIEKLCTWHDYFAWLPTEIKPGHFVWFEKVLRRAKRIGGYERYVGRRYNGLINSKRLGMKFHWEYSDTLELLKGNENLEILKKEKE